MDIGELLNEKGNLTGLLSKMPEDKPRLLFICMGNACRSQLAEALARYYWGDEVEVYSAGLTSLGWIPTAVYEVMEEIGVPMEGQRSKRLDEIELGEIDLIINLSGQSLEGEVPEKFKGRIMNWYIRDPYGEDLQTYRQARDAIEWLVTEKLPRWLKEV